MSDESLTPKNFELELPQEVKVDNITTPIESPDLSSFKTIDFHSLAETPSDTSRHHESTEEIIGESPTEIHEGIDIPQAPLGFGAVAITGVALATRIKNRRNRQRSQANLQLSLGAREELERHETQSRKDLADSYGVRDRYPRTTDPAFMPEFDYIKAFSKTHMQRRLQDPINPRSFSPNPASSANNYREDNAHIKAGLRADARRTRVGEIDRLKTLYGDIVSAPKNELEEYINQGNFPKKYEKSLLKAGKKVRRRQRSAKRIDNRLIRQANGNDIPGRIARASQLIRRK